MRRIAALGLALTISALAISAGPGLAADFPAKGDPAKAEHRTLSFRGMKRAYLVQPVAGTGPFPIVIALHGATVSA